MRLLSVLNSLLLLLIPIYSSSSHVTCIQLESLWYMLLIRGQVIHKRTSTESTSRSASISIASFSFVWRADAERSILADAFDSLPFLLSMTTLPKEKDPTNWTRFLCVCVERDGRCIVISVFLLLLFLFFMCISTFCIGAS